MIVERTENELLIRLSTGLKTSKIQSILDYLRYEELTSSSTASQEDVSKLVLEAKKGRWELAKNRLGLND